MKINNKTKILPTIMMMKCYNKIMRWMNNKSDFNESKWYNTNKMMMNTIVLKKNHSKKEVNIKVNKMKEKDDNWLLTSYDLREY